MSKIKKCRKIIPESSSFLFDNYPIGGKRPAPEYARCRELMETWRRQTSPWYLTWKIIYEFLRLTTHPRVMPQPWDLQQAWRFVEALLSSPALIILPERLALILKTRGNKQPVS